MGNEIAIRQRGEKSLSNAKPADNDHQQQGYTENTNRHKNKISQNRFSTKFSYIDLVFVSV